MWTWPPVIHTAVRSILAGALVGVNLLRRKEGREGVAKDTHTNAQSRQNTLDSINRNLVVSALSEEVNIYDAR